MGLSNPATIPSLLEIRAKETPDTMAYFSLDKNNKWQSENWLSFYNKVLIVAGSLYQLGVTKGQHAAIMASTSLSWELCHHALLTIGCTVSGIDPRESVDNIRSILETADINILLVDQTQQLSQLNETDLIQIGLLISLTPETGNKVYRNNHSLSELLEKNTPVSKHELQFLAPLAKDIATIIFTSGTTGAPKGIAYRHEQIVFACEKILETFPVINSDFHFACWLPLSNLFQRIVNLSAIGRGSSCYFINDPKRILELLPQINPHIFISVPRFFEKLYEGFEARLNKLNPLVRTFIFFILNRAEEPGISGYLFRRILSPIVKPFKKIFGNNVLFMISGSAPMPLWLLKRYYAMDILILEAYGMSENVLPIAMNRPEDFQFGSVGKAMSGNQIKLADDNELLVKGLGLFNGYFDMDNHNLFNFEGYLPSGDYAEIDVNGFIELTGRKSEVFKTSTGQKIAPASIEALINQLTEIDQSAIMGSGRKFLIVVITLSEISRDNNINELERLIPMIKNALQALPVHKTPAGLILSRQPFTLENDEITTNLKLKRRNILKNFEQPINRLYEELDNPLSLIHKSPLSINDDLMLLKL